ncbi:MAG: hypothetical protein ACKO26_08080 [Planctomycetota bacterium]
MSTQAVSPPEWLASHNGTLTPSKDGKSWLVHVGGELVYVLALVPVQGRHGIKLMQTINGKLTPVDGAHGTPSQALEAGLAALRDKLGW